MSTLQRTATGATRAVRVVAVSMVLTLLPATLVAHALDRSASADDVDAVSAAAVAVVGEWRHSGLRCGTAPRLTDTVVVEWPDGTAGTVSFDRALEIVSARAGVLRAYCV